MCGNALVASLPSLYKQAFYSHSELSLQMTTCKPFQLQPGYMASSVWAAFWCRRWRCCVQPAQDNSAHTGQQSKPFRIIANDHSFMILSWKVPCSWLGTKPE